MNERSPHFSLLCKVLARWDSSHAAQSLGELERLTAEDAAARLEVYAQLIPVFASSGQRDTVSSLRERAHALAGSTDALAPWREFIDLQWYLVNDKYSDAVQAGERIAESLAATPHLKSCAGASMLSAYRVLVEYEKLVSTGTHLLAHTESRFCQQRIHSILGSALYEMQLFDSAESHLRAALELAKPLGGRHWLAEALVRLGGFEGYKGRSHPEFRGRVGEGIALLERSLRMLSDTIDLSMRSNALSNLCACHLYLGSPLALCRRYAGEALRLGQLSGHGRIIAIAAVTMGDIELRLGEYAAAGEHFLSALPLIEYPFHHSGVLSAGMIAVSAAAGKPDEGIAYRNTLEHDLYRWSKNRLEGIAAYQRVLEEREREQAARQHEMERLRIERDLASFASHLAAQTELLSKFRDELRAIVGNGHDPAIALALVKEKLRALPNDHIDWSAFETQFTAAHPEFGANLRRRYPDLTPAEVRLCKLLRLDLKSHEIARLCCRSQRTIETQRLAVRRKLGLLREQDIAEILSRI